jgi:NAD+ kinase
MKVAVFGQPYKNDALIYVIELLDALKKVRAEIVIEENFKQLLRGYLTDEYLSFTSFKGLDSTVDLFVSYGGDGTILRAITYIKDLGIPIVGVNVGRLGFLSTSSKEGIRNVVQEFLKGNYSIVERSLISVTADLETQAFGNLNFALNEVTVSRKDTTSMITVNTYLNEEFLASYWVDGLIISTPTGSTGYSLSCGGPVIVPNAKSLVLTPIAPHNLNVRPLVISDDMTIRLNVSGRESKHLISLDSRITSLQNGQDIIVKKAKFSIKMIEYASESFLKTLRDKLLWGADKRN